MREKRKIGRGKWKEDRMRRKEKKMRDHFWSIFQGKEKASTSFWERHVIGSENAAAKLWQAAVCRLTLEEEDGIKGRERNERQRKKKRKGERERPRSLKVLEKWRRRGNWSMAVEAPLEREILYNWKASLKMGTFLSLRSPSHKSESLPTHVASAG